MVRVSLTDCPAFYIFLAFFEFWDYGLQNIEALRSKLQGSSMRINVMLRMSLYISDI